MPSDEKKTYTIDGIPITGLFSMDYARDDLLNISAAISGPERQYNLYRNPAYRTAGKFMSLHDFLLFSKSKHLAGVLISIENAAYLAENKGLSIINAVFNALSISGYNNLATREVIIQSRHKSILTRFKKQSMYKLMYMIDEDIGSADDLAIKDIKSFADIVAVSKESIFTVNQGFLTSATQIVSKFKSFNFTVYVYGFRNDFVGAGMRLLL